MARHPSTEHLMRLFTWQHLPAHLQELSRPFANLATELVNRLPDSPELSFCLRQLVLAKDAAVRCEVLRREDEFSDAEKLTAALPMWRAPALTSVDVVHTYTEHGYKCCHHAKDGLPKLVAKWCGGPNICKVCANEADAFHKTLLDVTSTPHDEEITEG